jgi:hypothetical protein
MSSDAMSVTMAGIQEMRINTADDNALSVKSKPSGTVSGQSVADQQMKRLLQLIENNTSANAIGRDTTNNILVRIDIIERKLRSYRGRSDERSPPKANTLQAELPSNLSRVYTGDFTVNDRDSSSRLQMIDQLRHQRDNLVSNRNPTNRHRNCASPS